MAVPAAQSPMTLASSQFRTALQLKNIASAPDRRAKYTPVGMATVAPPRYTGSRMASEAASGEMEGPASLRRVPYWKANASPYPAESSPETAATATIFQ